MDSRWYYVIQLTPAQLADIVNVLGDRAAASASDGEKARFEDIRKAVLACAEYREDPIGATDEACEDDEYDEDEDDIYDEEPDEDGGERDDDSST